MAAAAKKTREQRPPAAKANCTPPIALPIRVDQVVTPVVDGGRLGGLENGSSVHDLRSDPVVTTALDSSQVAPPLVSSALSITVVAQPLDTTAIPTSGGERSRVAKPLPSSPCCKNSIAAALQNQCPYAAVVHRLRHL
ncbi:hypothetical protein OROHE_002774 [Orobanche hederae]